MNNVRHEIKLFLFNFHIYEITKWDIIQTELQIEIQMMCLESSEIHVHPLIQ